MEMTHSRSSVIKGSKKKKNGVLLAKKMVSREDWITDGRINSIVQANGKYLLEEAIANERGEIDCSSSVLAQTRDEIQGKNRGVGFCQVFFQVKYTQMKGGNCMWRWVYVEVSV